VTFTFANGQGVTQSWNATVTQSGAGVSAQNASWNGSPNPGGLTAFGFIANWTGTNAAPSPACATR